MRKLELLLFILLYSLFTQAQNPKLETLTDSVKIGDHFQVSITYTHKPKSEVFFPDSTYDYGNLEYIKHFPLPTKTDSLSLDSAVYTFSNFNIQDSTEVKLPLYILSRKDSIKIESNSDYIFTKRTLIQFPDSLVLKTQLDYIQISKPINYGLFSTLGILILITLIVLLIIFRKKIKVTVQNYFLKKKCKKIFTELDTLIQSERFNSSLLNTYSGLSKNALELISGSPISSFTTSQIRDFFKDDFNTELFTELDKHIYRSSNPENIKDTLHKLKSDLESSLQQKLSLKDE